MAHELSDSTCTPWWYHTPSLASQSTYQSYYLSSDGGSQADPPNITPSQSSGYESPDATYTPSSWGNTLNSLDLLSTSTAQLGPSLSAASDVRNPTQQDKRRTVVSQVDPTNELPPRNAALNESGSVISLTVNVHLTPTLQTQSSSGGGERQDSLTAAQSSQYTLQCSPEIVIAPVIRSREHSPADAFVTEQSGFKKTVSEYYLIAAVYVPSQTCLDIRSVFQVNSLHAVSAFVACLYIPARYQVTYPNSNMEGI